MEGEPPPNLKILLFPRTEMVVKCSFAGQFTGQGTIGELLLLKEKGRK